MKNIIEINIHNYEDVIEKFDNNKLSREFANFIYNQYTALSVNKGIELNISSNLTEDQETHLTDMVHRHFGLETQKVF